MPVLKANEENIRIAGRVIREGGIVAFPTETVYGLGANALNEEAVKKVFEIKKRPFSDPLIVHIANKEDLFSLAVISQKIKPLLEKLISYFWPGPLTIVLYKKGLIPDIVTAGLPKVGIRMPAHEVALKLIKSAGVPVAAPSANPFGKTSPVTAEQVEAYFGDRIFILDGGKCPVGVESTVLDLTQNPPVILRPGGVPLEKLKELIPEVTLLKKEKSQKSFPSPGLIETHYSPEKPLKILTPHLKKRVGELSQKYRLGLIAFKEPLSNTNFFKKIEVLSSEGDLREAASNLFSAIFRMDRSEVDLILVEPVPEKSYGIAIMDRLRKAEFKGDIE